MSSGIPPAEDPGRRRRTARGDQPPPPPRPPQGPPQGQPQGQPQRQPQRQPQGPRPARQAPPEQSRESRWFFIIGAILVPVLLAVIAIAATYRLAPAQEVKGEEAKKSAEARQLSAEPPMRVRIEPSWSELDVTWLLERPLSATEIAAFNRLPVSDEAIRGFAESRGAVRVSPYCGDDRCTGTQLRFKMRMTGHRPDPVQITQIRARVVSRQDPPKGTHFEGPTGGSEDIEAGFIALDGDDLRLYSLNQETREFDRPYFDKKYVYLQKGEPIVMEVFAASSTMDYRWELVIEVLVDGKPQQMVVRADGTSRGLPFRTPGRADRRDFGTLANCNVGESTCRIMSE